MGYLSLSPEPWTRVAERVAAAEAPISWSWAAVRQDSGRWRLGVLSAVSANERHPESLRYPSVVLVRERLDPAEAGARLRTGVITRDVELAEQLSFEVPTWDVHPHYRTTAPGTPYPSRSGWPEYWLRHDLRNTSSGRELTSVEDMVSPGLPIYPDALAAVSDFVFGITADQLGRDVREYIQVSLADRRGRLGTPIYVRSAVVLPIETRASGARLRVGWREPLDSASWQRYDPEVSSGKVRISCRGVPVEFRAYLCFGEHIVDARGWSEHETIERPEGPQTPAHRLRQLIRDGEGVMTEFKQDLSTSTARLRLARTVAAFANGAGGTVMVGVDDEGNVVGCDSREARDAITDVIRNLVDPTPPFTIGRRMLKGKPLLVLAIPWGADRPYRAKRIVTIRVQATTRDAVASEVREMIRAVSVQRPMSLSEALRSRRSG